jgi:predicted MFS family arabinose efflux permease
LSGVAGLGVLLFVSEQRALARRIARDPGVIAGLAAALRDPVLRPLLLNTFVAFCAFSAMWSTAGLWGQGRFGWGPREVGIALALAGATGALAQGFLCGHVVRRLGETATIVVGLLFGGVFLLAEAFSPSTLFAVSAVAFASVGQAIAQPPVTSLISQSSSPEQQGSALGANTAAGALGRTAGPIVAGALFSLVGPTSPIFFAAAGMAPAAWLAVLAGRALRRRR